MREENTAVIMAKMVIETDHTISNYDQLMSYLAARLKCRSITCGILGITPADNGKHSMP